MQDDTAFSFPINLQGLMTLSCGVKAQDQTAIKAIKDRVGIVSIFTKVLLLYINNMCYVYMCAIFFSLLLKIRAKMQITNIRTNTI